MPSGAVVFVSRPETAGVAGAMIHTDERRGGLQALDAPSQLSHTLLSCCASTLLRRSGPEAHGLTVPPRFGQ